MATNLYNPFKDFYFDGKTCFLSGEVLQSADEQIQVFPTWLMRMFSLEDKPFKLLDESLCTYSQLRLPCSAEVAARIDQLDQVVEVAFSKGYEAVREIDGLVLFQWVARVVYGVVFNEIRAGLRQQLLSGEQINFSQVLTHKFKNLHLMLQSLILPIQFDGRLPFTTVVVSVDNPESTFSYRDEINTLIYSLRMRDFGIIVCLQDNGANGIYHKEEIDLVSGHKLHPVQFEELCARFFYSAYLFNRLPNYTVATTPEMIYVEPMQLSDMSMKPVFDNWQVKTYGQVLENFWKPWGYTLFEIIKDPENPMSFLRDNEGILLAVDQIDLAKE